jgi:hypothetical protein
MALSILDLYREVLPKTNCRDCGLATCLAFAGADGSPLNRWEQVFLYNHLAMGGSHEPEGRWKALEESPNTVSK